jgi:hypothetical protein
MAYDIYEPYLEELARLRAENRRLALALTKETARTGNLRASLDAVREALGDAAGQTGTLAEDVAALVALVKPLREALTEALDEWECAAQYKGEYLSGKHDGAGRIARSQALLAGPKEG